MSLFSCAGSSAMRITVLAIAVSAGAAVPAGAQETVSISVPLAISFPVTDVSRSTSGTPSVTTVGFSNLSPGIALRVSVQADAAAFTPPGGSSIPVAKVSWNNLGASGGIGSNGILSSSSFALVFQSDRVTTSGHVDLGWTLGAPAGGIRAGSHQLTIRWKVESITP